MKYEQIKIGDVFRHRDYVETVISKSDKYRVITTIDNDSISSTWTEGELHILEPIKEELPEEGLLVSKNGSLAYRLSGDSGYGFVFGSQSKYTLNNEWEFRIAGHWKPATPEQEKKFIKMLKTECEKRGLFEDTKIEANVDEFINYLKINDGEWLPKRSSMTSVINKNGQIFYKGKFATPLKDPTLELVSKAVYEIGDFTIEQTESGVIILTPLS